MKPGGVMAPGDVETSLGAPMTPRPCGNPECSNEVDAGPADKIYCGPKCGAAAAYQCKAIPRRNATEAQLAEDRRAWHERRSRFNDNPFRGVDRGEAAAAAAWNLTEI